MKRDSFDRLIKEHTEGETAKKKQQKAGTKGGSCSYS
jgi:hypothetical protein